MTARSSSDWPDDALASGKRRRYRLVRLKKYRLLQPSSAPPGLADGAGEQEPGSFGRSRHEMIAEAAYRRAEQRGFRGGSPEQDWYAAEAEVEELLRDSRTAPAETPKS